MAACSVRKARRVRDCAAATGRGVALLERTIAYSGMHPGSGGRFSAATLPPDPVARTLKPMHGPNVIVPKRAVKAPVRDAVTRRCIRIGSETSETRTRSPARKASPRMTSGLLLARRSEGLAAVEELPSEPDAAMAAMQPETRALRITNFT